MQPLHPQVALHGNNQIKSNVSITTLMTGCNWGPMKHRTGRPVRSGAVSLVRLTLTLTLTVWCDVSSNHVIVQCKKTQNIKWSQSITLIKQHTLTVR